MKRKERSISELIPLLSSWVKATRKLLDAIQPLLDDLALAQTAKRVSRDARRRNRPTTKEKT